MLKFFLFVKNPYMKKLIAFIFILVCFCMLGFYKTENNPLLACENVEKVCFVSDSKIEDMENVLCGDMVFNYCTLDQANEKIEQLKNDLKGIEFYIKETSFQNLCEILDVEIISESKLEEFSVYCCYTPYGEKSVEINGKKINLQVAVYEDMIIAGFPMLLTGF